jgi:Fur family peroxide stress response transcriptional regulator
MEKKTKQKEAILKVLRDTNSHPTADWIYTKIRKDIPNISLGTVYRNLKILKEKGEILELDLCGNLSRFDAHTDDHYHFRCDNCQKVFDLHVPVDQEINKRVALDSRYKVTHHRLEFRGLCKECE